MRWTIRPRRGVLLQVWLYVMCGLIATPLLTWLAITFLTINTTLPQIRIVGALSVLLALATFVLGAWPVAYVIAARVILTPECVIKAYPFHVSQRTLSRRDFGRVDSYRMGEWTITRFHNKQGKVVFKLGTNWWPPDEVNSLIRQLE